MNYLSYLDPDVLPGIYIASEHSLSQTSGASVAYFMIVSSTCSSDCSFFLTNESKNWLNQITNSNQVSELRDLNNKYNMLGHIITIIIKINIKNDNNNNNNNNTSFNNDNENADINWNH